MARPRRTRSPHPGVVLIPPGDNHASWRARYLDPDRGARVKVRLPPEAGRTVESRRAWAITKARELARRSQALDAGAPRATGTSLAAAIERYFDDQPHLSERTRKVYRLATDRLAAFAARHRIELADDLTGPRLVAFRAELAKAARQAPAARARRGAHRPAASGRVRSAHTVNKELRSVATVLTYLRRLGLLPRLTGDDIRDGLRRAKAPPKRIDWRKPAELRQLLEAALRHDAATYAATRAEHAGDGEPGSTRRYPPIAPAIVAALITGLRAGHLLALRWDDVDLQALGPDGAPVGEIVPQAGSTTKRAGVIGLEISPALRRLLAAMKLRSGGTGAVFQITPGEARAALKRLRAEYGAPPGCAWQAFRRTCECYLVNAPGIFGAASAYRAAKMLGHSVTVAERHYVDLVRGIPRDARTVEAAMQITAEVDAVIAAVGAPKARPLDTGDGATS